MGVRYYIIKIFELENARCSKEFLSNHFELESLLSFESLKILKYLKIECEDG
jgi:hypothetical protein